MTNLKQIETVSKPQNKDFYSQFFTSSNVTKIIGYFGQLVSGLTEFHLFFTSSGGAYNPFWITSNILPSIAGLVAIFLFEILGVRVYLVRIIRQIVNKDFGTWERVVLFAFNMLFVLALCGANLVSSWLGQSMTFASKTNVTTTDKTHGLELEKTAKLEKIKNQYNSYNKELTTTYQTDKTELINRYDSDVKQLEKSQKKFKDLEWKYNQYTLKIDNKIEAKQNDLIDLKNQYNANLKLSKETYLSEKNALTAQYDKRINDISKTEKSNVNLWATVQKFTLPILIGFILLSWFAIVYNEIFIKGSGQKIEIKEVEKRPLLIVEILTGIYDKIYQLFYYLTALILGSKKYQFKAIKQQIEVYNVNDIWNKKTAVNSPKIAASNIRKIGFEIGKKNNGSDNQLDNQKHPINNLENTIQNTPQNTLPNTLYSEVIASKTDSNKFNGNVQRYTVNVDNQTDNQNNGSDNQQKSNIKPCKNCGKHFTFKHWNAKYCSDKCRIESWEKRTGKTLKKKSKKH